MEVLDVGARPRSHRLGVVVVCVSVVVALCTFEGGLRAFDLYRPPDEPILPEQPEVYHPDPDLGYTLWPSRTTAHRYPESRTELIPLVSNSDGFRNAREFDAHDGRPRILVVGDSFVFGLGVRAEDRLTEQLEGLEPRWQVDNMGMTGWGLDLMIRSIEHLGRKADPDVVVLAVYTDDFRRLHPYYAGLGYPFPKFELSGSQLTSGPYEYPQPWERLRLVQAVYRVRWRKERDRLELNRALLDRFLVQARTIGFAPVVLFLPGTMDGDGDRTRRGFLAGWAASHDLPFLDLTSPILGAGVERTFLPNNWHWSPEGHGIAARELKGLLRRSHLGGTS